MQNRYTGDIGDFAKYGLLRVLTAGERLGVAWYLYPDESHNEDGKHTSYLHSLAKWRHLDPLLFDQLNTIIHSGRRLVSRIEDSSILGEAIFSGVPLDFSRQQGPLAVQRRRWFSDVLEDLQDSEIVFADPDNGLCADTGYAAGSKQAWKRMPLSEANELCRGRTGILYHHNTRRAGGHALEIQHWLAELGDDAIALYWRKFSPRTFFLVNPSENILRRAETLVRRWTPHFELVKRDQGAAKPAVNQPAGEITQNVTEPARKACPECGHQFVGPGWVGIDAHWKSMHGGIMAYSDAWPIIKSGGKPSAST